MKGIIVVTYPGSPWLSDCIASLVGVKYPVYLCINPPGKSAYDMEAFYYAKEHKIYDFFVLHDSMVIKDISLFDKVFELKGNVQLSHIWQMGLGKFNIHNIPELPTKPTDKLSAIRFENSYLRTIKVNHTLFTLLKDTDIFEEKHGKKRMIIENEFIRKYKGTWSNDMVGKDE